MRGTGKSHLGPLRPGVGGSVQDVDIVNATHLELVTTSDNDPVVVHGLGTQVEEVVGHPPVGVRFPSVTVTGFSVNKVEPTLSIIVATSHHHLTIEDERAAILSTVWHLSCLVRG